MNVVDQMSNWLYSLHITKNSRPAKPLQVLMAFCVTSGYLRGTISTRGVVSNQGSYHIRFDLERSFRGHLVQIGYRKRKNTEHVSDTKLVIAS